MQAQEIDQLINDFVFSEDKSKKEEIRKTIWQAAESSGIKSVSIQKLYEARGRGEVSGFTVPAINIRAMVYDSARAIFRAAIKENVGAFVLELARSEMSYSFQDTYEFSTVCVAAALRENYSGPVFIQGDHFQVNAKKFHEGGETREKELKAIKDLIAQAIDAGYRNIDIDASTIVDLSKETVEEQQRDNFTVSADLTAYIRSLEPEGVTISVGGEIGEVGKQNSTPEEFRVYMNGFMKELEKVAPGSKGPTKASVQTGSSHGGIPLPDGSVAKVSIDFGVIKNISEIARNEYGMAGAVQHGASTLPTELFDQFPKNDAAEIHLATDFQNIIYDHPSFPNDLKTEIYEWLKVNCASERKSDQTEEQFLYKTRKKAWGPFKHKVWSMPENVREEIRKALENKYEFLFQKLNVSNTKDLIKKYAD